MTHLTGLIRHAAVAALCLSFSGPALAAECTAPSAADSAAIATGVTRLRASVGLSPLQADAALTAAAARQACDMARNGRLTHRGRGGVMARARAAGYVPLLTAENVASGEIDANLAISLWMQSPGHRANMLNNRVRHVGIGQAVAADGRTRYWALVLGAPR